LQVALKQVKSFAMGLTGGTVCSGRKCHDLSAHSTDIEQPGYLCYFEND